MDLQRCCRCRCEEYIPTHQYVKFDDAVNYLCKRCWDLFRKWFFYSGRVGNPYVDSAA